MASASEQVRAAIARMKGEKAAAKFSEEDLKKLTDQGYVDEDDLRSISRESLIAMGLKMARVDALVGKDSADVVDNSVVESIRKMLEPIERACVQNISATMSASKATKDKVRSIEEALGIIPGPMEDIEKLLGARPGEGTSGFDWDGGFNATENQMRQEYARRIQSEVTSRTGVKRGFQWLDARNNKLKKTFEGVPFPVSGKNDEVYVIQSYYGLPELGAVLGVELKKKLTWQAILQMETEFFLWSAASVVPYVQSVTDLTTGGVVCYLDNSGGRRVLRYKVFLSMDSFYDYLASVIKALPAASDLTDGPSPYPDELRSPKRVKLQVAKVPDVQGGIAQKDVWKLLWDLQQEEDVACLADVERLEDWGIKPTPIPSYFC